MPLCVVIGVLTRTKKFIFRTVRRLPYIGKQIDAEVEKQCLEMEEKFHETAKGQSYLQKLPAEGMSEVNLSRNVKHICSLKNCTIFAAVCSEIFSSRSE